MKSELRPTVFLIALTGLILAIVAYRFDRYYVAEDYAVEAYTPCDPTLHSCFVSDMSIADPAYQSGPYEKVDMRAEEAPHCLEEHTCNDFSCDGAIGCSITYCTPDHLDDGETCTESQ